MEDDDEMWRDAWEEQEPEYVMGFNEGQARTQAGGKIMAGEIEGGGRLARLQELQQKRNPAARHELRFMEVFSKIKRETAFDFGTDAEEVLKDGYIRLRHSLFKDPALYLFASIAMYNSGGKITKKGLSLAKMEAGKTDFIFLTEDLIRYCLLLGGEV